MDAKILSVALIALLVNSGHSQTPAGVVPRGDGDAHDVQSPMLTASDVDIKIPRGFAPLASAVVPGSGQMLLGDKRSIVYAAVEALSWWNYGKAARDQANQEANSKSLARNVGRAHFTTGSPDALPDGPWAYYEAMRDHLESGQYSLAVGGEVVPETDVSTYNGYLWQLALSTNATHAGALAQYKSQAIKPDFEWSWRNAQLQYDLFARTTFKRNDAANAETRALLVIISNHVLSMVDAFTTIRLRARREADGRISLAATVPW